MNNVRGKAQADRYGGSVAQDYAFNQKAGGMVVVGPTLGKLIPLGDTSTAKDTGKAGNIVAIYNPTAGTLFAKTGNAGVAAPTSGVADICLKPNDYTIISLGEDTHVRTSAGCFAYVIESELIYAKTSGIKD